MRKAPPEQAIEEARAVASILGPRLLALEIGNEVDTYGRGQPFRSPAYDYSAYRAEFQQWRSAIARAVPGIRFAAPDTARSVDWVERMAEDAHGEVQLLTTHYYRNPQARGNAEQLMLPDPRLAQIAQRTRLASQRSALPWRMCEFNSFFRRRPSRRERHFRWRAVDAEHHALPGSVGMRRSEHGNRRESARIH